VAPIYKEHADVNCWNFARFTGKIPANRNRATGKVFKKEGISWQQNSKSTRTKSGSSAGD
jgi:hypothetical protein